MGQYGCGRQTLHEFLFGRFLRLRPIPWRIFLEQSVQWAGNSRKIWDEAPEIRGLKRLATI
jgi:hypothetical protein